MPTDPFDSVVISFASPKGGVGKTTAALLLATELAHKGVDVTVIDADPERHIGKWGSKPDKPKNLHVFTDTDEESIVDDIEDIRSHSRVVIIDLEGSANINMVYAIANSDLVIIPMQPSDLDAAGMAKALNQVKKQEKTIKRPIPHAVLFTRMSTAIRTRTFVAIDQQFRKKEIPVFQTQIMEREVYRSIFSFGGTLHDLDPKQVTNVEKAITNAQAFAAEVLDFVEKSRTASPSTKQVEVA